MNFSEALDLVKIDGRLFRKGWMVKDACIYLVKHRTDPNLCYIELHTVSGNRGYTATSPDLLANDWEVKA